MSSLETVTYDKMRRWLLCVTNSSFRNWIGNISGTYGLCHYLWDRPDKKRLQPGAHTALLIKQCGLGLTDAVVVNNHAC